MAGTSAGTWRRPGRPAGCWCQSGRLSVGTHREIFSRPMKGSRGRGVRTLSASLDGAAHLFEQGEYEEGEEPQAGRGQQAGLLDGQHRLTVGGQRVDGCVGQRVSGVAETGCD